MFDWFYALFQNAPKKEEIPHFGRFIELTKTEDQQKEYQLSKQAFSEQRHLDGYAHYFNYLQYFDENTNCRNVTYKQEENILTFRLIQGSAIITGDVTPRRLKAHANIAHALNDNIAVMRRLLERNYMYTYSSFNLENEILKAKIYFDNTALSPQKIFFPLRELSINADKEKELLLDEFNDLEAIELDHIEVMNPDLKETKLRFFREWIDKTEQKVSLLPSQEQSGAIAFVWLNLLLKIDYFVTPRGKLGYDIYEAVQAYYVDDNKLIEEKNDALRKAVEKLKELDRAKLEKSLYPVKQSFDIFTMNHIDEVRAFIDETLGKIVWYKEHRYEEIILNIYEYLGLYALFTFGMNDCLRQLFQFNVRLHNPDFFAALGLRKMHKSDKLDSKLIAQELGAIFATYTKDYPYLKDFSDSLNYQSLEKFHYSYFNAIKSLNFNEL